MRRLMYIAAFVLVLAMPLWAQRSGAHAGGGHGSFSTHGAAFAGHGGFNGGHGSGVHFSPGIHSGFSPGTTHSSHRTFTGGRFPNSAFAHNGFHRGFRHHGVRDDCWGVGCRGRFNYTYPWGAGYYDPWLWNWWDSGSSSYDDDYERDRALANEMNHQSLEEQRMLEQEEADGDRDSYDLHSSRSRSNIQSSDPAPVAPISPTLLVFRDQQQKEVRNYAIVGSALWNFAPQHTERISLADLDIAATIKVNDDRGVTFRVPASTEAR